MTTINETINWIKVAQVTEIPEDAGIGVKIGNKQYAIFHFASIGKWFATQNQCPHKKEMALSRGIIGNAGDVPKVACAMHKNQFSLETGKCLNNSALDDIKTYLVKVEGGDVFIGLGE